MPWLIGKYWVMRWPVAWGGQLVHRIWDTELSVYNILLRPENALANEVGIISPACRGMTGLNYNEWILVVLLVIQHNEV